MSFKIKVGDLLETQGRYGFVTKVTKKKIHYYICHSNLNTPGETHDVDIDFVYKAIDNGTCTLHLGSKKYRRKRVLSA